MDRHSRLSPAVRERALQPRNYGPLFPCDGYAQITGPCGDTMEFWIRAHAGRIVAIGFSTTGCGTSRAAGSMATELALGQTLEAAARVRPGDVLSALDGLPSQSQHCAQLACRTLQAAVSEAAILESADPSECGAQAESGGAMEWGLDDQ